MYRYLLPDRASNTFKTLSKLKTGVENSSYFVILGKLETYKETIKEKFHHNTVLYDILIIPYSRCKAVVFI